MITEIKCGCGNSFNGIKNKEDTCPKCLKELINPPKKLNYDKFKCRTCSFCKEGMDEGFCINDGEEYYCSSKCLDTQISQKDYYAMYENGTAYWTEWDKKYEYLEYLKE